MEKRTHQDAFGDETVKKTHTEGFILNESQQKVIDAMLKGRNVLLSGPAGSGKSALIKYIAENYPYGSAVTATTGVVATALGGRTLHSALGLRFGEEHADFYLEQIRKNKKLIKFYHNLRLLIVDECSMLSGDLLELINELLQAMKNSTEPLGGIRIIFVGDFMQLGVVIPKHRPMRYLYLFDSPTFKALNVQQINLTQVYRQADVKFTGLLSRIRMGKVTDADVKTLKERVVKEVPPMCVVLHSKNINVDGYNNEKLDEIDEKEHVFKAKDENKHLLKDCRYRETLKLKVGAFVMLLKNMKDLILANGSTGVVKAISLAFITVDFGGDIGEVRIPKDTMAVMDQHVVLASRTQFPLALAWAVTVHKSQGQQFDRVFFDCEHVFADGQFYTAISRCKRLETLYLMNFSEARIRTNSDCVKFYSK